MVWTYKKTIHGGTGKESHMDGKKLRGRPKLTWEESIRNDLTRLNINTNIVRNREIWRMRIHVADPKQLG